jgi:pimeloyl-ACP methyl ester carboxylesterase
MLTSRVESWRRQGAIEEVLGRRLFVRRAGSPPVFVVAHDMGTSVATELMALARASTN